MTNPKEACSRYGLKPEDLVPEVEQLILLNYLICLKSENVKQSLTVRIQSGPLNSSPHKSLI